MAILYLPPVQNPFIAPGSRLIRSIDIHIQNLGEPEFDILTHGYTVNMLFLEHLNHLAVPPNPDSLVVLRDLLVPVDSLFLQFFTDITLFHPLSITIYTKNRYGETVGLYTHANLVTIR
ncbi:MAG TPA: hypothetical protein VGE40_08620 [Bacilli bacterium]